VRIRSIVRAGCALTVVFSWVGGFAATASAAQNPSPIAGYWSTDATGQVFPDGDASFLGDLRGVRLNAPIVGIAATPDGRGYWLAAADGGVFGFGDARYFGSAANLHLNAPIVGIAATGSGRGYWLAASDGGVFTYGDATFLGSAGNLHLNAPVVGIASVDNDGYRLAASDGGVFAYGDAPFAGVNAAPTSAIATSPFGGYVLLFSVFGGTRPLGNASSCEGEPVPLTASPALLRTTDSTQPRFVGVAAAFDPSDPRVVGGALATVSCHPVVLGGNSGAFHAPARWRVDFGSNNPAQGVLCSVRVAPRNFFTMPPQPSGSIQMRRTQMAGHSVFEVDETGRDCWAVASTSFSANQSLPFTTNTAGDSAVFSSLSPITIHAHGTCTTEVRADSDGRLIQRRTGSSYTMHVPGGTYWLSNTPGCTVSAS
jgi:hypothetical protein